MKKTLLFCFLILTVKHSFSCECVITPLLEKYQRSDFVAKVKILKVKQDEKNKDYQDIEFELINLFKGMSINQLKIESLINTSCSFLPSENSIWLIFASRDQNGYVSTGACSGSEQIDQTFDLVKYPNLDVKHKKSMDLKLEVIDYLNGNKLTIDNKFKLTPTNFKPCLDDLKGYEEENRFAVYEVIVKSDLSIKKVKVPKRFKNTELSKKLTFCLRENMKISAQNMMVIPEKAKMTIIYFYYSSEKNNQSFISIWDL